MGQNTADEPRAGSAGQTAGAQNTQRSYTVRNTDDTPPGEKQRFIKNNRYFTICIYGVIMILASAVIFKAIIDIEKTKDLIGQILGILSPFIFGILIAYILNPMVHVFYRLIQKIVDRTKRKIKHSVHTGLSILVTYLLVFSLLVIILRYVLPEITSNIIDFANSIPYMYDQLLEILDKLQEYFPNIDIAELTKPLTEALPNLISTIRDMAGNIVPAIYTLIKSAASWIVNALIAVIVSIYILFDKRRLLHGCWRVIYAFLPQKHIPACQEILAECNRIFNSFVVGKFIDSTIIGVLCAVLMTIMRLSYVPLISIIVGVTNMIPYFGPFIGAIPSILILLFVSPLQALAFTIMILCLQQFDGLILGPKILGNSTGMKPLWIIFAITIGGSIAGLVGMFLGVPVCAVIGYLFNRYLTHRLEKKNISETQVDDALEHMELDD